MAMGGFLEKARRKIYEGIVLKLDAYGTPDKVSTFQKTGKCTPEEFVAAGDFLVENFKSWEWTAGLPDKRRAHLPVDKQFLQTRNVSAYTVQSDAGITEKDVEGDWVEAELSGGGDTDDVDSAPVATIGEEKVPAAAAASVVAGDDESDDDDDDDDLTLDGVAGIDEYDYDVSAVADDDDAGAVAKPVTAATGATNVDVTRTYDITITYDVHYSTPRVWLFGYDAQRNPLMDGEWRQDFSKEHIDRTVTFETHPHLGFSCPTIHPCKHAEAMKRLIALTVSGHEGAQLDVKYYMLIFLKFIQSIIPNIEYDYTGDFQIESTGNEADDGGS